MLLPLVLALLPIKVPLPGPDQAAAQDRLKSCFELAQKDPASAIAMADAWLAQVHRFDRAAPQQCAGEAYANLMRWKEARDSFVAARDALRPNDYLARARLGGMAGNAALAANDASTALADLDKAAADAGLAGDLPLAGSIGADEARALVALGRNADAAAALAKARSNAPKDAEVWLLSATLSRRMGDLKAAQGQIETAGALDKTDPAIGLEAGVIAELAGNEDAARKSWQSVVALAPKSPEADSARAYLAQIGGSGGAGR